MLFFILMCLLGLYAAATIFAGLILIEDYRECKAHLAKVRAEGIEIFIKCGEKCLRETRRRILSTPFVGLIFTMAAIFLVFDWLSQKLKSLFRHPKTI